MQGGLDLTIQIDDATWSFLEKELGIKQLLELVVTTSYYNHVIRVVGAVKISIEGENGEADREPYQGGSLPKHENGDDESCSSPLITQFNTVH
ncbi:MAG: hypothetical protein R3C59_20530 [Planctomycetaceae bacterium]